MKTKKIPQRLQAVLWSTDVKLLDIAKDKGYIIHQIFSYGSLNDIAWLFQTYPKGKIIETFIEKPYKDYRDARFAFVKNQILGLKSFQPDERLYVKNIPRAIG